MRRAHAARQRNTIGAAALALADELRNAADAAVGAEGALAAGLVTLGHYPEGTSIDNLASGLGVSHSRAVRVVDQLEADGWARRSPDPVDRRAVRVGLTAQGRDARAGVLRARARALDRCLAGLTDGELDVLGDLASAILDGVADSRAAAWRVCRLCDSVACGHDAGRCPVTRAAARAEALQA